MGFETLQLQKQGVFWRNLTSNWWADAYEWRDFDSFQTFFSGETVLPGLPGLVEYFVHTQTRPYEDAY